MSYQPVLQVCKGQVRYKEYPCVNSVCILYDTFTIFLCHNTERNCLICFERSSLCSSIPFLAITFKEARNASVSISFPSGPVSLPCLPVRIPELHNKVTYSTISVKHILVLTIFRKFTIFVPTYNLSSTNFDVDFTFELSKRKSL